MLDCDRMGNWHPHAVFDNILLCKTGQIFGDRFQQIDFSFFQKGMRFGKFLSKRIFEPLGMKDTAFYVPQDKQARLSKVYEPTPGGLREYHGSHLAIQNRMEIEPAFESGGAGLVSTIDDYKAFSQMLLHGGSFNGVTLLSWLRMPDLRLKKATNLKKERI